MLPTWSPPSPTTTTTSTTSTTSATSTTSPSTSPPDSPPRLVPGAIMPADTLLAMSTRAAASLASRIGSVGDLPPKVAIPILAKVTCAAQLYEIEQSSPQIVGHIDDVWLAILKRDVPGYESRPHRPSNPANWYKVYKKLKKEADAEATVGRDALKAAMQGLKQAREANVAVFVDKRENLPRAPTLVNQRRLNPLYLHAKAASQSSNKHNLFEKIRKEKADVRAARYHRSGSSASNPAAATIIEERKRLEAEKRREREMATSKVAATVEHFTTTAVATSGKLSPPQSSASVASWSRKRSADEAGLTVSDLEGDSDSYSDHDHDHDHDHYSSSSAANTKKAKRSESIDEDEVLFGVRVPPAKTKPVIKPVIKPKPNSKTQPQINVVKVRVDGKSPSRPLASISASASASAATATTAAADQDATVNDTAKVKRAVSPNNGSIVIPPAPPVRKRAAPSIFCKR